MPRAFPIADPHNPSRSHSTAPVSAFKLAILHFFEPGVLPVLAMALIVGGWSYGLKLSHYLNTGVTKASTTRMWLDHRNDAAAAPLPHQQVEHKFPTPHLDAVAVQPAPHLSRRQLLVEPAPYRPHDFVSPLHSLRAPPTTSRLA